MESFVDNLSKVCVYLFPFFSLFLKMLSIKPLLLKKLNSDKVTPSGSKRNILFIICFLVKVSVGHVSVR